MVALVAAALAAAIAGVLWLGQPRPLAAIDLSPRDGATDVPRTAQVMLTFSRPLDEASVRAGLRIAPEVPGFVSVAGRRAAFTSRGGFRGDTTYTVTLGPGVRDRGGRGLADPLTLRFRTQPLGLVFRAPDGRLWRGRLGGPAAPLTESAVGAFAVGPEGGLAYVRPTEGLLLVESTGERPRHVPLPGGVEVRELEWAPGGRALLLLGAGGATGSETVGVPYVVRLDGAAAALEPFGPRPRAIDPASPLVVEALKKSLVEIVYGHESFAFTPDGRGAIVRDENWDFAVVGLDGTRRASLGPYLAVGNASARGDALAVVDVNPADPALPRQVVAYGTDGTTRRLSAPGQDSHAPRFAHQSDRLVLATGPAIGLPRERRFALELVDLGTGARRRLTEPPVGESDEAPRWSPDDAWVSFRRVAIDAAEGGRAWIVPVDGGAARPLTPAATDVRWLP